MLWAMAMILPSGSRLEVLLPMSNVIAIHNVSEQFFINESSDAADRKEKPGRWRLIIPTGTNSSSFP